MKIPNYISHFISPDTSCFLFNLELWQNALNLIKQNSALDEARPRLGRINKSDLNNVAARCRSSLRTFQSMT